MSFMRGLAKRDGTKMTSFAQDGKRHKQRGGVVGLQALGIDHVGLNDLVF